MAQHGGWGNPDEQAGGWNLGNCAGSTGGLLDNTDPSITATEVADRWNVPLAAARKWVKDRPFRKSSQAAADRHYGAKPHEEIDPQLFVDCMQESGFHISLDDSKYFLLDEYQGGFTWQGYQDASAEYEEAHPDVQRCEVGGWVEGEPDVQAGGWGQPDEQAGSW